MRVDANGIEFLEILEGFRAKSYQDGAGVWTCGYGTTMITAYPLVHVGPDTTFTQEMAQSCLQRDIGTAENTVKSVVTVSLTQSQYNSLVSFCYNVGPNAFRTSTLLKKLNMGDYLGASEEFVKWDHCGNVVVQGLLNRREAERDLFLAID